MDARSDPPAAKTDRRQLALVLLLWGGIAALLFAFQGILRPFLAALLIAYVIAPLVDRLARLRLGGRSFPRWAAILTIYCGFFLALYLFAVTAVPQLYREVARMTVELRDFVSELTPAQVAVYSARAEEWLSQRGIPIDLGTASPSPAPLSPGGLPLDIAPAQEGPRFRFDLNRSLDDLRGGAETWAREHLPDVVRYSQRLVAELLDGVFLFFFMLMVSAFVLVDVGGIHRYFGALVPSSYRGDFEQVLARIDVRLAGVVRGQLVICVVNGLLTLLGLAILNVKFALILATVATVLSLIPIFGSILSTIPIVLVALSQSWEKGLLALAWIVGIHALEAYFLNPKIMGTAAKIHPALIAFALLAGERTFGFVGALFAVPIASILIGVFEHLATRARQLDPAGPGGESAPAAAAGAAPAPPPR